MRANVCTWLVGSLLIDANGFFFLRVRESVPYFYRRQKNIYKNTLHGTMQGFRLPKTKQDYSL
jgi:hypothetical protein